MIMKKSAYIFLVFILFLLNGCNGGRELYTLPAPEIRLEDPDGIYTVQVGKTLTLAPQVLYAQDAVYAWMLDGNTISTQTVYVFTANYPGTYYLTFKVIRQDIAVSKDLRIDVERNTLPAIFLAVPENGFFINPDSTLTLHPIVENSQNATYTWKVNEVEVNRDSIYLFSSSQTGAFQLFFSAENTEGRDEISFPVTVSKQENNDNGNDHMEMPSNKHFRPVQNGSRADWNVIYEYMPAPGQFINESGTGGFSGEKMLQEALLYAQNRLQNNLFVSLGAFGGYIVAGFDHSIENDGGYNLQIEGNAHENSSEPGIVWVMQDSNGNGSPDDSWFELKGSEDNDGTVIRNYAITYFKPRQPGSPVHWIDNNGKTGTVDYLGAYHNQETYYPLWIETEYYTLTGTCLESRNYLSETGSWISPPYDRGYADNDQQGLFSLSDAITPEGDPVDLEFIDFVKIQTGVNGKSGWLGEVSTEITGIWDYNLLK
jgi:hypothetical protein